MLPEDLKTRLGRIFESQTTRRALLLGGSLFAAWTLGFASADLIESLRLGVVYAIQHVPLLDAAYTVKTWFAGAMSHVATIGLGLSDWANSCGVEVGRQARDALLSMQAFMGSASDAARDIFHGTLSQTKEFASFWMNKTGLQMPTSLTDAAVTIGKGVGKAVMAVAEVWGAYEVLKKGYDWAVRKVKGDISKKGEGVQIGSVQNLQLTIAIGGEQAATTAGEQLRAVMKASEIVVPEVVIEKAAEAIEKATIEDIKIKAAETPVEGLAAEETPVNRKAWDGLLKDSPWPSSLSRSNILWASQEFQKTLNTSISQSLASSAFPGLAGLSQEILNRPLELVGDILVLSERKKGRNDPVFDEDDPSILPRDNDQPPSPPLM